jgi:hypothetical protein
MERETNPVILHRGDPETLEGLYGQDPEGFRSAFSEARRVYPDDVVLAVWWERLRTTELANEEKESHEDPGKLRVLVILTLFAGLATRGIFHLIVEQQVAPVNLLFGVAVATILYLLYSSRPEKRLRFTIAALLAFSVLYMNLLPLEDKDSILLAYLHLPVVLWMLVGLAFAGDGYGDFRERLRFLRFNGEFCIYYASMAIAGMLLTLLTLQLFSFLGMDIADLYFENAVVFGAGFLALVSVHLVVVNLDRNRRIAPLIARIFSPVVLLTLLAYLVAVVAVGENPFIDRDFLLSFNFVLMTVLAVTIYSITEERLGRASRLSLLVNMALILLTLVVDVVALAAILFRLSSYGLTPNRLAVLGMNLTILVHLVRILIASFNEFKGRGGRLARTVVGYLPVYGLWAAIVSFAFPLLFP